VLSFKSFAVSVGGAATSSKYMNNENIETEQSNIEKENNPSSDIPSDKIDKIDTQLEAFNPGVDDPEEIQAIQKERDEEYNKELSKLEGIDITEETKKEIYNNMVNSVIDQVKNENQQYNELLEKRACIQISELFNEDEKSAEERLEKLKNKVGEKDYKTTLSILKSTDKLFDRKGELLHATNSFAIENMQELNSISGGLWQKGASFTDGDSEIALLGSDLEF